MGDIEQSCTKVLRWTSGLTQAQLPADEMRYDAVMRNLQIIGEAVKHLSPELRSRYPGVPWQRVAGFRDIVTHAYFGVDDDIVWDVVQNKVPDLLEQVQAILSADPPVEDQADQ